MNRRPYQGAYSRRFSNYSAANKETSGSAAGTATGFNISCSTAEPEMGEVKLTQISMPSGSVISADQPGTSAPATRGAYAAGCNYRAEAKPFAGFRFVQWQTNIGNDGNTHNFNTRVVEFKLEKDTWLIARFEKAQGAGDTSKTANVSWDGSMGRVTGNGLVLSDTGRANSGVLTANAGSTVTLTASPLAGYHFVKWQGVPVDGKTTETVSFQMNNNYNIKAVFAADNPNSGGGNVVGGGGGGGSVITDQPVDQPTVTGGKTNTGKVKAFVKKWWWAILIVAYVVYKEGGKK